MIPRSWGPVSRGDNRILGSGPRSVGPSAYAIPRTEFACDRPFRGNAPTSAVRTSQFNDASGVWNMTCFRTGAIVFLTIVFAAIVDAPAQANNTLPSTDDVVAKMVQQDEQRQADFAGYTATRHYLATNKNRRAEMVARVDCSSDGVEQFQILSENGSGTIRQYVFHKLLKEEADASRQGNRDRTRITPQNYTFQIVRQEVLDTGPAYVLSLHPKSENKFLMKGIIWVDAHDYSIVRIDGQPARSPSFWLRSVHFVRTYRKVAQMWLTSSIHSTEDLRLFGPADLWIETSDYVLKSPTNHLAETGRTPPTSQ